MSNIDATRVMGVAPQADAMTVQMGTPGDTLRTQMGGTTTCPVCKATTPILDSYCGDCGFMLTSEPGGEFAIPEEVLPAATLVDLQDGRRYALRQGVNSVGRQGTDILSSDPTVSRNHASITISEAGIVVEDLGSSNGTKISDVRLQPNVPIQVQPGATIRFGTWKLMLEVGAGGMPAYPADQTIVIPDMPATAGAPETVQASAATSVAHAALETYGDPDTAIGALNRIEGICGDIYIHEGTVVIGRRAGCDILLPDPYLSGRHAEIVAEQDGVYLVDVGSTNGTFVNGQRLAADERQQLLDGDEVQLGQTKYSFGHLSAPALPLPVEDAPEPLASDEVELEHSPEIVENAENPVE
jgi:pSer/pThr/pTyr-binding forkhead associated (FHA) protein